MYPIEVASVNSVIPGLYTQAFYIGRPGPLGNPYKVKEFGREGAINNFYSYLKREEALGAALSPAWAEVERIVEAIVAHPGGNYALVCHCAPLPCHGDVVLRAVGFHVWRRLEAAGSGYANVWKPSFQTFAPKPDLRQEADLLFEERAILEFQGEHRWLSNFWPCEVEYEGMVFPSSENAYQSAKFPKDQRGPFLHCTPSQAKKLGRGKGSPEFHRNKLAIMYAIVRAKFRGPGNLVLASKLVGTGCGLLQEGNYWGDMFWGVDLRTGRGENNLGKILMRVREEIAGL